MGREAVGKYADNANKYSPDIRIRVLLQLLHSWYDPPLHDLLSVGGRCAHTGERLKALCHVEADIGDGVIGEVQCGVKDGISDDNGVEGGCHCLQVSSKLIFIKVVIAHGDGKDGGHSVEVIWVFAHRQHSRDNSRLCPLDTEDIRQFLEVDRRRLANGEHRVAQPVHAQCAKLVIEKVDAELSCQ